MITKPRIFIAFAIEDKTIRDFLVEQAQNSNSPFEFIDFSVKEPYESAWKTKAKDRIRGVSGVIAVVSRNSLNSDGQLWELKCARELGKPIRGIWAYKVDRTKIPGLLTTTWTWKNIKNWIERL